MVWSAVLATTCVVLASFEGCGLDPFVPDFEYERVRWSLLPASDGETMLIVELYSGLHSQGDVRAAQALAEMLERRRVYPPEGGLLSSDLDGPRQATPEGESPEAATALEHRLRDLSRVLDAGLFLDESGELCGWRVTELVALEQVLTGIDRVVSAAVLRGFESAEEEAANSWPWFDESSRALAKGRALAGGPWVRWLEGRITLDWPISDVAAARALETIAAPQSEHRLAPWFLSQIACLHCGDGRAVLTLGSAEGAAVVFEPPRREQHSGPDQGLIQQVRAASLPVGDETSFEQRVGEWTRPG